ncbi:hypothetical protein GCM10023078_41010 [Gibbsiella greigii]
MKTAAFSATGDKTLLKTGGLDQIAVHLLNRFSQNKAHYTQSIAVAGNVPRRRANATVPVAAVMHPSSSGITNGPMRRSYRTWRLHMAAIIAFARQ